MLEDVKKDVLKQTVFRKYSEKTLYEIEYGIRKFEDQDGYFSVVAHLYEMTKNGEKDKRRRDSGWFGTVNGTIVSQACKKLADIASFHLRHYDGSPMYPVDNGMFFLGYSQYSKGFDLKAVCDHFMITEAEAVKLHDCMETIQGKLNKLEYLQNLIDTEYRHRWRQEAEKIRLKYGLIEE